MTRRSEVTADARPAHRDEAHTLVGVIAELGAQRLAVGELGGVEAGDVAGELEVRLGPLADGRQVRSERVGHDVVGIADEDRAVTQPAVARPLLDHLGVVVGGQGGLVLATVGHRQPADEVGHPGELEVLQFGVLVEEVVDVPGLVADHEVVVLVGDDVVEHHEVVDEDLVHPADRLEGVEVVLGRLVLDVGRLVGQPLRCRVDSLAAIFEDLGDRVLGEPVDLQVGVELPQLGGDGNVAQGMAESDRRGDVQRLLRSAGCTHPGARLRSWVDHVDELLDQLVDDDGIAKVWAMAAAPDRDDRSPGRSGDGDACRVLAQAVLVAVDDEDGARHLRIEVVWLDRNCTRRRQLRIDQRLDVDLPTPIRSRPRSAWWSAARRTTRRRRTGGSRRSHVPSSGG